VALDNDANVAAYAELETGAGHDISNFLYVTLGTGVGGCIILNGEIVRGTIGGAGEFGHTIIKADDNEEDFEKSYRTGVLEEYIGKNQIINLAKKIMEEFPKAELGKIKNPDVRQISEFISKGDPVAIECFKRVGHYLGVGITSVLNLLDLRVAIIGGGISQAHSMLLETALQTIRRRALPSIAGEAEVRLAEFSNDAGMIGAALLGKSSI
jgi:glucokinase